MQRISGAGNDCSRGTLKARSTRSARVKKTQTIQAYYCNACGKTISYKSSGKKAFHLHAEDAKHKASFRTVKSNQVSRFLYLSNWKRWYCEHGHLSTLVTIPHPPFFLFCLAHHFYWPGIARVGGVNESGSRP